MIFIPTYDSSMKTIVWFKYRENILHRGNPNGLEDLHLQVTQTPLSKFNEWIDTGFFLTRRPR
ncbi:hypothetical protein [Vibrio phage BUCT194]|uniref:Uncharacterized protein n=1 Tax=Vibrio phage BUCT194 TaxID=2859072 RepID=A0AAE9BPI2_9CAUD|nr:hypothetical protein PP741_gp044 [Vibrio phage BUCT194]UAW01181.1 hypothetical protein [Vibrio phage BUCT194]